MRGLPYICSSSRLWGRRKPCESALTPVRPFESKALIDMLQQICEKTRLGIVLFLVGLLATFAIVVTSGGSVDRGVFRNQIHLISLGENELNDCAWDTNVTVAVAGLPRSGSTMAYNIVRMLLMQYQPSLLYGWISDSILNKPMKQYISNSHHNLSIVYKTHRLDLILVQKSDLIIFTHRDPIDQLCSLGVMFDGEILKNCSHAQKKCRWLEGLQRDLYSQAKNKSIIDLSYEEISNPLLQHKAVDKLVDKLSINAACVAPSLYYSLANLRPPAQGTFLSHHPFTLIHAGHIHADKSQCNSLKGCLLLDSDCESWVSRGGRMIEKIV